MGTGDYKMRRVADWWGITLIAESKKESKMLDELYSCSRVLAEDFYENGYMKIIKNPETQVTEKLIMYR